MLDKATLEGQIIETVEAVKRTHPMAASVTNFVTIDFVANAQLAVGGSAAMVFLPDEGEGVAQAGGAMYLNMGTLIPVHQKTMPATALALHKAGKPWVVDPVGLGIGSLRTQILREIMPLKPTVIRCNASEAIALASLLELDFAGEAGGVRGVDSTDSVEAAASAAVALAQYTGGAVAVSGEEDLATDGETIVRSFGGSAFMPYVTGTGCALGGVAAVYAACAPTPLAAAVAAANVFDLAGARAGAESQAPASFKVAFLDQLYLATAEDIAHNPMELAGA